MDASKNDVLEPTGYRKALGAGKTIAQIRRFFGDDPFYPTTVYLYIVPIAVCTVRYRNDTLAFADVRPETATKVNRLLA
jgi:hypothetical protein